MKNPSVVTIIVLLAVVMAIKGSRNGFLERFGKAASGSLRVTGSA